MQAIGTGPWQLEIPHGHGHETYFVSKGQQRFFVKLGADPDRWQAMAKLGISPEVFAAGYLPDGQTVMVQPFVAGRNPTRQDYHTHLEQVAHMIQKMHQSPIVQASLPRVLSQKYSDAGLAALQNVRSRWQRCRPIVLETAKLVDTALDTLEREIRSLKGLGLVASHGDICNANWLVTPEGQWYLVDLESMSLDDPALDVGAILWWYYPPALRPRFLQVIDLDKDDTLVHRMRVRMALHCLHILLPRDCSYDRFHAPSFLNSLDDLKAALAGKDNPQGYEEP